MKLYDLLKLLIIFSLLIPQTHANQIITFITQGSHKSSFAPTISKSGRYIAFHSNSSHLIANDTNQYSDIFVYDRHSKKIERVSVGINNSEANFVSFFPDISADGRYVTFHSDANNLVAEDTNRTTDIFVYDRNQQITTRVSVNNQGIAGNLTASSPAISGDGRFIVFHSDATNLVEEDTNKVIDIFLHDVVTKTTRRINKGIKNAQADGNTYNAAISQHGEYIVFSSEARNLAYQDMNKATDVFLYHRITDKLVRISNNAEGEAANDDSYAAKISADGRYIVFTSRANNLVEDDTNEVEDIFLYDHVTKKIQRISVDSHGQQANQSSFGANISAQGRYIVFNSLADNLVIGDNNQRMDVFVHDRLTQQTECLTLINNKNGIKSNSDNSNGAYSPAISSDGRWVVFESEINNLVKEKTSYHSDIFLYDRYHYPFFDVTTNQLTIPAITLLPDELGQVVLSLADNLQFSVTNYEPLNRKLINIHNLFDPNTQTLYLPMVEMLDETGKTLYFYVEMKFDVLTGYLVMSHIQQL